MKRLVMITVLAILFIATAVSAEEELVPVHKVYAGSGEQIRFIQFQFMVPYGCGALQVFAYEPTYPIGDTASWRLLTPGTLTDTWPSLYKIVNGDWEVGCSFHAHGEVPDWTFYGAWNGREVEPEDLGLLVRGGWVRKNVFRLSVDDKKYSYMMINNMYGRNITFEYFLRNEESFLLKEIIGVIFPDDRGFLTDRSSKKQFAKIKHKMIRDDEIIILIIKEQ